MSDEQTAYYTTLRREHLRRRQQLTITAARYGNDCPPHIINEIEDIDNELQHIDHILSKRSDNGAEVTTSTLVPVEFRSLVVIVLTIVFTAAMLYMIGSQKLLSLGDLFGSVIASLLIALLLVYVILRH